MTRDYSQFMAPAKPASRELSPLEMLGWQAFYGQQCDIEEMAQTPPARVVEVHRNGLHVLGDGIDTLIPPGPEATVGDWILFDAESPTQSVVLERKSLFKRRAPGTDRRLQLIAANVDTSFIVTSCNQDFNIARLERYVALAFEAEVTPVIVLTKVDLCDDVQPYETKAAQISDRVIVLTLNALSDEAQTVLKPWCGSGQTIAFMGSSGVGKSTLVNALSGDQAVVTASIREDDAKGRHTTTRRQLHFLGNGCAILDTPGMRELQMTGASDGIADLFSDLAALTTQCKFSDCAHETEPGCAVRAAVKAGEVSPDRLKRWAKLVAEERFNSASFSERRENDKAFHKMVRTVIKAKNKTRR
jgi:ribosome biogenesis GTPase